jgi:hypothetical protein
MENKLVVVRVRDGEDAYDCKGGGSEMFEVVVVMGSVS